MFEAQISPSYVSSSVCGTIRKGVHFLQGKELIHHVCTFTQWGHWCRHKKHTDCFVLYVSVFLFSIYSPFLNSETVETMLFKMFRKCRSLSSASVSLCIFREMWQKAKGSASGLILLPTNHENTSTNVGCWVYVHSLTERSINNNMIIFMQSNKLNVAAWKFFLWTCFKRTILTTETETGATINLNPNSQFESMVSIFNHICQMFLKVRGESIKTELQ